MAEVFKGMQKMYNVINISCRLWCGYTFMFIYMPPHTAEDYATILKYKPSQNGTTLALQMRLEKCSIYQMTSIYYAFLIIHNHIHTK